MNSRSQVDLQSQADDQCKTKLVRPSYQIYSDLTFSKKKRAEEVAYVLLDILTIFGASIYFQSDNGREFSNNTINELGRMWPELKMVYGKRRYS